MGLLDAIQKLLFGQGKEPKKTSAAPQSIYVQTPQIEEIHSIWDYIKLVENTQTAHVLSVLGFEEWVAMEEILRRIKEVFGVEYPNKRSLYPYVKTLVDVGLVESTSIGEKKKWRKKDTLIKLKAKTEDAGRERIENEMTVANTK